jgi:hypothetical protein
MVLYYCDLLFGLYPYVLQPQRFEGRAIPRNVLFCMKQLLDEFGIYFSTF